MCGAVGSSGQLNGYLLWSLPLRWDMHVTYGEESMRLTRWPMTSGTIWLYGSCTAPPRPKYLLYDADILAWLFCAVRTSLNSMMYAPMKEPPVRQARVRHVRLGRTGNEVG